MQNYYFNVEHERRPFTHALDANENTLPPDNALRIAPDFKEGYWPCEQNGTWVLVEDHRGKMIYSLDDASIIEEVKDIGEIKAGFTLDKPVKVLTLEEGKQSKLLDLKNKRDLIMLGGVTINGIRFYTEKEDQATYTTLILGVMMGIAGDTNFKTASGYFTFKPTELTNYILLIKDFVQRCFDSEKLHIENVEKLEDIEDVISYDVNEGWPDTQYTITM